MVPRLTETIERFRMVTRGDRVLIAVSGGPDSVALLHAFLILRPIYDLTLHVVHVNHGLRSEAEEEAAFVANLAEERGVPWTIVEVKDSVAPGDSVEAWARRVRYGAVQEVARDVGAGRIALGHTADDQAETVLMRLLQGAGPRGLSGIPATRGPFIRPLIRVSREAILSFLKGIGARWVEDRSNEDSRYLRNRLRRELLPELGRYNPAIRSALLRVGDHCREAWETLARLGKAVRDTSAEGERFHLAGEVSHPVAVINEALRQWVEPLVGRPLRQPHLEALSRLVSAGPTGGMVRLPGGATVEREGSDLVFSRENPRRRGAEIRDDTTLPISLEIPGRTGFPGSSLVVEAKLCPREMVTLPRDLWSAAFDRDALEPPLEMRSRRPGDSFRPFGFDGTKSLKKLLNEARVLQKNRDRIPIVTARGEIIWVVGHRRGAAAPVTAGSRQVLLLEARPVEERERRD